MTDDRPAGGGSDGPATTPDETHATADQGTSSHDSHAHDDMGLGPIDWPMWTVGLAGVASGILAAVCFAFSVGYLG